MPSRRMSFHLVLVKLGFCLLNAAYSDGGGPDLSVLMMSSGVVFSPTGPICSILHMHPELIQYVVFILPLEGANYPEICQCFCVACLKLMV